MNTISSKAHIIVIGNEKGGTGKSTLAMHLAVKLLMEKFKVAAIDLDGRQSSLTKYITNRRNFISRTQINLPIPIHYVIEPEKNEGNKDAVIKLIEELSFKCDAIIIDTPGSKNYLFELAHQYPHTLITPVGDSMIDLSVIADTDFQTGEIINSGHYAEYVWEIKKQRAAKNLPYLNWIVCGNKISPIRSNNKTAVLKKFEEISKLYGFRFSEGLKDRVIYKELFLEGLTVLDLANPQLSRRMSLSHLAAKMELNALTEFIFP